MSLVVVGSVALDSVKTPHGAVDEALGGSATYFSTAASYFTTVRLAAVVGEDFPEAHLEFLRKKGVILDGLERKPGQTFRWRGEYGKELSEAKTLETHLNVFETFRPRLPASYTDTPFLFLANIDPALQYEVLSQVKHPKWVACDTMNFWISGKRDALLKILGEVDALIINEGESYLLAQESHLPKVAKTILGFGPKRLIIKRGEYGAVMFTPQGIFSAPAYPVEKVIDPTGAGDSFAGGFMGYLAASGEMTDAAMRRAVVYGSVMASFNVEAFSLDGMRNLTKEAIIKRYQELKQVTFFEGE